MTELSQLRGPSPSSAEKVVLVDVSDMFFCSGEGKGESESPGRGVVFY